MTSFAITVGSSSARIAAFKDGRKEVLANAFGERQTPALVTYLDKEILVGHSSKELFVKSASNTALCMTLLLGQRLTDDNIQEIVKELPCQITERNEGLFYCFKLMDQDVYKHVSEPLLEIYKILYACMLRIRFVMGNYKLPTETARTYDPESDMTVVVGVPTYYSEESRMMISDCISKAGFQVLRIVSEPAAACLEYGIGQRDKHYTSHILVYDLGMWKLDLTVLQVSGGMFQLVASQMLLNRGGRLFDKAIADLLITEFERQWKLKVVRNKRIMHKLEVASESAKCTLSNNQTVSVHLESLYEGIDFQYSVSRGRFEGVCSSLLRKCVEPIDSILNEAQLHQDAIGHVVLIGGSCKLPQLRRLLKDKLPNAQHHSSLPPENVAILGCAQEAGILMDSPRKQMQSFLGNSLIPCTPSDLWISCPDSKQRILPKNTPIPCHKNATIQVNDISQCAHIELQEGSEPLTAKSIALIPLASDLTLISLKKVTVEASITWSTKNEVTWSLQLLNSPCAWEHTVKIECQ